MYYPQLRLLHPQRHLLPLLYQALFIFGCIPLVKGQSTGRPPGQPSAQDTARLRDSSRPHALNTAQTPVKDSARQKEASQRKDTAQPGKKVPLGSLAGYIATEYQYGMAGATVSAMDQESGLFLRHTLSDENGKFTLRGLPIGRPTELRISFAGCVDTSAVFTVKDTLKTLWTGTWNMRVMTKELEAVMVTRRKPPFVVKKDTLEFDATQFKTLPNDMVKDLLRKLPGMQIGVDGKVTLNGKPVDRIKVDGREFMGGSLESALENVPGAIIDKVQVTDTRERGEENTSIVKKKSDSYTLNLTLKKGNKIGVFGTAEAGKGSPGIGWAKGFLSASKGTTRFTAQFGASNVNPASFGSVSTDNISRGSGLMTDFGGGQGIVQNAWGGSAGLNTNLGKKSQLDLNYMVSRNKMGQTTDVDRQTLLPDSSFFYRSRAKSVSDRQEHHLMGRLHMDIDSLQTLDISPRLSFRRSNSLDDEISRTTTPGELPINRQDNRREEQGDAVTLANNLVYSLSSRNRRTHVTLTTDVEFRRETGKQQVAANSTYYSGGDSSLTQLRQHGDISNRSFSSFTDLTIKQDLSKKFVALVKYQLTMNNDDQRKDVFRQDSLSGKYSLPDSLYSNYSRNRSLSQTPSVGFGYTGTKLTAEVTGGMLLLNRKNIQPVKGKELTVRQRSFSPAARLGYDWNKYLHSDLAYSLEMEQPTAEQLAPVPDNSNPLVLRLGNAGLKSGLGHHLMIMASWNYPPSGILFSGFFAGEKKNTSIVENNFYDSLGRQVLSYANVGGIYSLQDGFSMTWSKTQKDWRAGLTLGFSHSLNQSKGFINQQENTSRSTMFSPMLNITSAWKEKIELGGTALLSYNDVGYSLPGIAGTKYNTSMLNGRLALRPLTGVQWVNDVTYRYSSQIPAGFPPSTTTWNTRLDYSFLKDQRLTAYCLVSDVLNKFNNVQRTVGATQIETRSTTYLGRCLIVGMKYRFSKYKLPEM